MKDSRSWLMDSLRIAYKKNGNRYKGWRFWDGETVEVNGRLSDIWTKPRKLTRHAWHVNTLKADF